MTDVWKPVRTVVVLVGPPRAGKSTYARELRERGYPTFCTDPRSLVKEPEDGVTYMIEGLDWSGCSEHAANVWMRLPGPLCIEGVGTVRALRKAPDDVVESLLANGRIVVFLEQRPELELLPGQRSMAKAVLTVWNSISYYFESITEYR